MCIGRNGNSILSVWNGPFALSLVGPREKIHHRERTGHGDFSADSVISVVKGLFCILGLQEAYDTSCRLLLEFGL